MKIRIKRIYDAASRADGQRVLVDRMWPRGVKKEEASLDTWARELAPSAALRKWFSHDPKKWDEFRRRYFQELDARPHEVDWLVELAGKKPTTLLFAASDEEHNNAIALREYLQRKAG